MRNIIIIGGSHAAVAAASDLRQLGSTDGITMLSAEASLPYQRPPLSKAYMSGEMSLDRLLLRDRHWYEQSDIDIRLSTPVISIDRANKQVVTGSGDRLSYDALVLATGASPRRLPAEIGGELSNVHVMRDLGDADALMQVMGEGRKLVVIGGGYIGLEAAAEAAKKGMNVTIVEAADRILKRVACAETSDFFRKLHEDHGVTILENTQIGQITGKDGNATAVELADGRTLPCDMVIVGIGVSPNVALAEAAGLEVAVGITVDENARTSDPDIYACGDCTIFPFHQMPTRLESVQNAHDQASIVAHAIHGDLKPYDPHPWFWSDQYDVKLQIAGLNRGYDTIVVRLGKREGAVSHFYFHGDTFLAADCLNDAATYAMSRKILAGSNRLTPKDAADPAVNLKDFMV